MSRHTSTSLRLVVFIVLMLACGLLLGGIWAFESLPQIALREFGPASTSMGRMDQTIYAVRLLMERDALITPVNPGARPVAFRISQNESVGSVAERLESQKIIRSAAAFRLYLIYAGLDKGIQAGDYQLNPAQNALLIAQSLQDSSPTEVNFRILPGWRLEEIAAALPFSGLSIKPEELLILATNPGQLSLPAELRTVKSLEGFLSPEIYRFKREASARELLEAAAQRFVDRLTPEIRQGIERQGLTLEQAVVLASIVQREAMVTEEQPMIASVFYNRLRKDMKLDTDPTVQYAVGYNKAQKTWWTNPLSLNDLKIDSPYNTYTRRGLPPGAICSPALAALQAVAFPAASPYFYFRAKCGNSGKHAFSVSYEEHLKNACP